MSPASLVQESLRKIAIFEAYYGGVISWLARGLVGEEVVERPPTVQYVPPIETEELSEIQELSPVRQRREFPFLDELGKVDIDELYQLSLQIAKQLGRRG